MGTEADRASAGRGPELRWGRLRLTNPSAIVLAEGTEEVAEMGALPPRLEHSGHLRMHPGRGINSSPRGTAGQERGLLKPSQGALSTWEDELRCDLCSFPTQEKGGAGTNVLTDTILQHAWTVSPSGVLTGSLSG